MELVSSPETSASAPVKIIVPAYFYPGVEWDRLSHRAAQIPGRLYAIANPANGPGAAADKNYRAAISTLRSRGGRVLGYVHTQYGKRNRIVVKKDIDRWYRWYTIDGIFLDEQANTAGRENYYQYLYRYIKTKDLNALVAGNPGAPAPESYLFFKAARTVDLLCLFENGNGFSDWSPPAWTGKWQNSNFCVLLYNTGTGEYRQAAHYAINRKAGWMYITDNTLPNPWKTLPDYFEDFCSYVTGAEIKNL